MNVLKAIRQAQREGFKAVEFRYCARACSKDCRAKGEWWIRNGLLRVCRIRS